MKKYNIIYADPPWKYDDNGCQGAAEKQYNTMTVGQLKRMDINSLCEKDCVLFMWATYPKLREALEVISAWGFEYKSIGFQWVKLNKNGIGFFFGLGRWTRGNTEPCLIAVKGKPKRISASVGQLVFSPLKRHSEKPVQVRDRIVQLLGDLPRVELFARQKVEGWDSWGNEVECDVEIKQKNENQNQM